VGSGEMGERTKRTNADLKEYLQTIVSPEEERTTFAGSHIF